MRRFFLIGACLVLAGCGDPLRGIERLSQTGTGGGPAAAVAATSNAPLLSDAAGSAGPLEREAAAEAARRSAETAARPPRGILAMLGFDRGGRALDAQPAGAAGPAAAVAEPARAAAPSGGGGLFSGPRRSGPDAAEVAPGTVLPYGQIARVCNLPTSRRGTMIANVSGYQVYDTIPNTTAARPFYVTGFRDGCARTFTGALVIAGDVGTHEVIRYQPSNSRIAYSATDEAYEDIKARICSAPRGQPCGRRLDALDRSTHFLTVYDRFGGGERWVEILLHNREVAAIGFKG